MPISILDIINNYSYAVYDKTTKENEFKFLDGNIVPENIEYHIYYTKNKNEYFLTKKVLDIESSVFILPIKKKTVFGQYKTAKISKIPATTFLRAYKISPIDEDYFNGYIRRYFAQQTNNEKSKIIEISKRSFDLTHKFYKKISLKWRLTGTVQQVIYSNTEAIKLASKEIRLLPEILDSPLQFYRPEVEKKDEILKKLERFKK